MQSILEERKEAIARLRETEELAPPWIKEPSIEKWKAMLGIDTTLDASLFYWQAWIASLAPENLAKYKKKFPEPLDFTGFYNLAQRNGPKSGKNRVSETLYGAAYWDALWKKWKEDLS